MSLVASSPFAVEAGGQETGTATARDSLVELSERWANDRGRIPIDLRGWHGDAQPVGKPVQAIETETARLLLRTPGSFLYDLGSEGWPHGWSPDGLDPSSISLETAGVSWNDALTGRPRFDLLPFAFFDAPRIGSGSVGAPVGVVANLRAFAAPRPETEIRYTRGAAALHAVAATHAQQRRISLFGSETGLHVLGGYSGRAAAGEYPGSRLRRERHVLARVTLSRPRSEVTLLNLHTRHAIGAHGGVIPAPGRGIESIYDRFGARVETPEATRRSVRNDLVLDATRYAGSTFRLGLRASLGTASNRFRNATDTLEVETTNAGLGAWITAPLGPIRPHLELTYRRVETELGWKDTTVVRPEFHLVLSDSSSAGPLRLLSQLGFHDDSGQFISAMVGGTVAAGPLTIFLRGSTGANPPALLHTEGYGARLIPLPAPVRPRVRLLRGGIKASAGALSAALTGFVQQVTDPIALVSAPGDTTIVTQSRSSEGRAGLIAELGLRRGARQGFYLEGDVTLSRRAGDATERAVLLPSTYGRLRGGLRYLLFRGDLDLHLYVEGRGWTAFDGRSFHAETGLLTQPRPDDPIIPASSSLGIFIEAGVREATVFVAWENVLAGTELLPGNMLVPMYPLQEQAFRFGVHWPIGD